MKILNNIETKRIVAIDIETVRLHDNYLEAPESIQGAWEYKNKQDGQIPENLDELWERNTSLYAEFAKVCAISVAFLDNNGVLQCKEFFGENESIILEQLEKLLNRIDAVGGYRLAGHAAKYFDYPFLAKRYIINGMDIPSMLDVTALKPWEQSNLCTNELWKVGGTGAGSSLQALCVALNIPISKVDLVGDEVGKAYYKGEYERIGRYCSYDAVATFNVLRRFKKEEIFQFDDVKYSSETPSEKIHPLLDSPSIELIKDAKGNVKKVMENFIEDINKK